MSSFNDYFETIKGMAVEGAQTAVKKTKQIALGKLYYKDYIVGEDPDPAEYNPWCEKISESKIAIEDLRIAIEDLKSAGEADKDVEDDFVVEITEDDLASADPAEQTEDACCCNAEAACCCNAEAADSGEDDQKE